MKKSSEQNILGTIPAADLIGRGPQLAQITKHATDKRSGCLSVLGAPGAGTSELLRQSFDRLFHEQQDIIPFYFCVSPSEAPLEAARRFASEFLTQTVAFRRRDADVIVVSPEMHELAELALPSDNFWTDRLVESYYSGAGRSDLRSFIRSLLSAPLRARTYGVPVFVMIDGLNETLGMDDGEGFFGELKDIYGRADGAFVFAGTRRFLFGAMPGRSLNLEHLSFATAGQLISAVAEKMDVPLSDQSRDLIALQTGGNAAHINCLFAAASAAQASFESFRSVERIYADEIFGGRIGRSVESLLDRMVPEAVRTSVIGLLAQTLDGEGGKMPVEYWRRHIRLTAPEFRSVMNRLNDHEIINTASGNVVVDQANVALADYLRGRARLEIDGESRALVIGESASIYLKRAPQLLARHYRRNSALGLRELLATFDCQEVASAALDYTKFKAKLKGLDDDAIETELRTSGDTITLPQIVYTANTAAFYSRIGKLIEDERSTIALGFEENNYVDETVWIAAEIDSKLEAKLDQAEFWCDRLEMVAVTCGFSNYKLWLIAPEGFNDEASEMLHRRGAFGSSRAQVDWLVSILAGGKYVPAGLAADEYEMIIPMGDDTEMIAAHAVEEIAKRRDFSAKAINQIKTALVEACINATEHSMSPDRRIYQKFAFDDKKITITVSNRGLRLADKTAREIQPAEGRRGWGLKLMKGLMDDVKIEQTDDGTRVTMVKMVG